MTSQQSWSWKEAARDLLFAIAFWVMFYLMFTYGGSYYIHEGVFPPPDEIEDGGR